MNKTQLAKALGISRSRLYQCIEMGMTTDSVESAREWRDSNIDFTMTDAFRPGGNTGGHPKKQTKVEITHAAASHMLRNVIPKMWFDEPGWLGLALNGAGIKVTAEQVHHAQINLLNLYMDEVDDYLDDSATFDIGPIMMLKPEDEAYPSLIDSLNKILN